MRKAVVIVMVLAMALSAAAVWAQAENPQPRLGGQRVDGMRPGMGGQMGSASPAMALTPPSPFVIDRNAEALGLSAEQATKLRDVLTKSNETDAPIMRKLGESTRAIRMGVLSPECDAKKIQDLVAAAQKNENELIAARIDTWMKIRGILTADQIAKLQTVMQSRGGPGGRRNGPGLPPAPGAPPPPAPAPAPAE